MTHPNPPAPKKVTRKLWRGILEFEDVDVPPDQRAFNAFGKSAILWMEHSRELFRSARFLVEERKHAENEITHLFQAPIALMLGAYALETILKMVIVAEYGDTNGFNYDSIEAKDFLPTVHDLPALAERAKLRINKVDRSLLKKLTRYSIWAGRYPIPRFFKGYKGPALKEAIPPVPDSVPDVHPLWPSCEALYVKVHALAVRKAFRGQGVILKPKTESAGSSRGKTVQRRD